jgi:hypothetical protein
MDIRTNFRNGARRVESKGGGVIVDEEPGIHYVGIECHQGCIGDFEKNFSRARFFGGNLDCINGTQGRSGDCGMGRHGF